MTLITKEFNILHCAVKVSLMDVAYVLTEIVWLKIEQGPAA